MTITYIGASPHAVRKYTLDESQLFPCSQKEADELIHQIFVDILKELAGNHCPPDFSRLLLGEVKSFCQDPWDKQLVGETLHRVVPDLLGEDFPNVLITSILSYLPNHEANSKQFICGCAYQQGRHIRTITQFETCLVIGHNDSYIQMIPLGGPESNMHELICLPGSDRPHVDEVDPESIYPQVITGSLEFHYIVAAFSDQTLRVWSHDDESDLALSDRVELSGDIVDAKSIAVLDNGKMMTVTTSCRDSLLELWEIRGGALYSTVLKDSCTLFQEVIALRGSKCAVCDEDGIQIWDSSQRSQQLPVQFDADVSLKLCPRDLWSSHGYFYVCRLSNGAIAAYYLDHQIRAWDPDQPSGQESILLMGDHPCAITDFVEAGGRYIVAACEDDLIRVWNRDLPKQKPVVLKQSEGIRPKKLAANRWGQVACFSEVDRDIKIWDVTDLECSPLSFMPLRCHDERNVEHQLIICEEGTIGWSGESNLYECWR